MILLVRAKSGTAEESQRGPPNHARRARTPLSRGFPDAASDDVEESSRARFEVPTCRQPPTNDVAFLLRLPAAKGA